MTWQPVGASPWVLRVVLGVGLWSLYMMNGREIGAGDTVPVMLQQIALVRGDGFVIDRFEPVVRSLDPANAEPGRFPPYYASIRSGHLVSRYSPVPMLVALPLVWPQVALLDARRPGWDATPAGVLFHGRRMAKNASAVIVALSGVVMLEVLWALGLGAVAMPATIVAALGSPLWSIASQSGWHHGPAVLLLAASMWLLLRNRPATLVGAGTTMAIAVAARPSTVVFVLPLLAWALHRRRDDARWLIPPLALGAALIVAYNVSVFGTPFGGQPEIEAVRLPLHDVTGSWANPVAGAVGTLVSPSRGLFLYCPWVIAALLVLPAAGARIATIPLVVPLMLGLVGHLVLFASYSAWWAGWSFGPRYWTEAIPAFTVLLAIALDAARARPWITASLYAASIFAVAVHGFGVTHYPSSWNSTPANLDIEHARLWDWRDTEITRGLREGPRAPEFPPGSW